MTKEKICSFFGHRTVDAKENIIELIKTEIYKAIEFGCATFYFGGYGEFDDLCYQVLTEVMRENLELNLKRKYCVSQERFLRKKTPYFNREDYDEVIYLVPSFDGWYKSIYFRNCAMCMNLNGCCFVMDKCPPTPLHPNCHCQTVIISSISAKAECAIEKIRDYIFSDLKSNGKKELFEKWGYSIIDSEYLQKEFEIQAKRAYSVGEYELGRLDDYGQRVNVKIKLKRKDKDEYVTFQSGWMVYPNGKIALTTPYGGKKYEIVK